MHATRAALNRGRELVFNPIPLTKDGSSQNGNTTLCPYHLLTGLSRKNLWTETLMDMVPFENDKFTLNQKMWDDYVKAEQVEYNSLVLAIDYDESKGQIFNGQLKGGENVVELKETKVAELEREWNVEKKGVRKWYQVFVGGTVTRGYGWC
eukprot:GHVS01101404.1.p1 GENE.GHVS01101404.1~~GHVS01101404.1.p1  ORF type:complete len:168 (+),score=17.40 GHVS01101404.1:54-506(+)